MLFPSYLFLVGFLPVAALAYWLLRPRARRSWLVVVSALFYGWADWRFLILLLGMNLLTFVAVNGLMSRSAPRVRRWGLALTLGNLAILAIFKYLDLFTGGLGLGPLTPVLHMALPLGISYYTFNLLSYGLDVYRGRTAPARSFADLLRYTSFFPTVTSGPLMRYADFNAQLDGVPRGLEADRLELGIFNLAMGLGKKVVIADWIGQVIDPLWSNAEELGFWGAWVAVLGYHFRLYFDFSGYCDMAVGAAHLLGIQAPANFRAPYTARSITEFWQRWHITLSTWFRDYVFFPLSLAFLRRLRGRYPDWIRTLSLVVTMSLIGLWHGPHWTYLAWGAYQGLLLSVHGLARSRSQPWPPWAGRALTTLAVLGGWVLFRSGSLQMAAALYAAMLGWKGWGTPLTSIPGVNAGFLVLLATLLIVTNLPWDIPDLRPRRTWGYAVGLGVLLAIGLLFTGQPTPFLYFQF